LFSLLTADFMNQKFKEQKVCHSRNSQITPVISVCQKTSIAKKYTDIPLLKPHPEKYRILLPTALRPH